MVKISDFDEYLHADAVQNNDIIEISGKAHYVSAEEATFGRPYLELPVKTPAGKTKIWTPNKTTLKKLAQAWGDETDAWLGKKVQLDIVQQNVRGEMRNIIYGTPLQTKKEPTQEQIIQ